MSRSKVQKSDLFSAESQRQRLWLQAVKFLSRLFFFNVVNQPDSQDRLQRHQEKKQTSEAEDKISDRLDYP